MILIKKITDIRNRYYKLLLVVGKHSSGKTTILKKIQQEMQCPLFNLNYEISHKLHDVPRNDWDMHIDSVIGELSSVTDQQILIDNIEILFSPEFDLNPLQILKRLSRTHVVIASWPGSYSGGQLFHGDIMDDEYFVAKSAEIVDIEICALPVNG